MTQAYSGDHSFSAYAKISKELTFFPPDAHDECFEKHLRKAAYADV